MCFVVKETSVVGILDDETCIYAICRSEFLHFRGLNASIFMLFFFILPKISRRFHFFVLEPPYMQSKGHTMRTTVRTVHAYEYKEGGRRKSAHLTRNNSILKSKMTVFIELKW